MVGQRARNEAPRYETLLRLAAGGMATVYVGTVRGALGFRQLVAIKKPHAHLVQSDDFRQTFLTEARLASLLHHANVVDVRDVEATNDELSLVMDYVEGASLGELLQAASAGGPPVTPGVAVRIVLDACAGLQAAHELTDERGRPLNLVHRDISPQNLLVGTDGVTRVADFGVAKFDRKAGHSTTDGNLKGKLAYMAPEYLRAEGIDRRLDVFAMGVVLWEALTGQRLFRGQHEADTMQRVLQHTAPPVSQIVPALGTGFDAIVETALAKSRDHRFDNAAAMSTALESSARAAGLLAGHREVAELVRRAVGSKLEERRALIRARMAHEPSVASAMVDAPENPVAGDLVSTKPVPTVREPTPSATDTDVTPPPSAASTERSPTPETFASGEAGSKDAAAKPPAAKVAPTTLKSEPAHPATVLAAAEATANEPTPESSSTASYIPGVDRPSRGMRYVAVAFVGGLLVAGGLAAFLRQTPAPAASSAATSAGSPPVTAAPPEPAPSAVTPAAQAAASASAAPSVAPSSVPAHAATASGAARAHPPRRAASPGGSASAAHEGDPPPNPYAPP